MVLDERLESKEEACGEELTSKVSMLQLLVAPPSRRLAPLLIC